MDAGKVRFIGVSNFTLSQLQEARRTVRRHRIAAIQLRYSLIDRTITGGLLSYCQSERVLVIAYSPLARGVQHLLDCDSQGVLAGIARDTGRTPAQVALNWCVAPPGVVAIPKGNSAAHIVENCGASDWRLTEAQLQALDRGIAYRRRSRLESLVRRHLPPGAHSAVRIGARFLPSAFCSEPLFPPPASPTTVNTSPSIEAQIRAFIAENLLYDLNGFSLSDEASFLREGVIDSLGVMQLVEFVRSSFHVPVDPREVTPENFDSVARLARFIERKRSAGQAPPA